MIIAQCQKFHANEGVANKASSKLLWSISWNDPLEFIRKIITN